MMSYVGKVIQDLLTMVYKYAGISLIVSILFMTVWQMAENITWKELWKNLLKQLKQKIWQKRLLMILYVVFVLQRTVFNRSPWGNPLENVIGFWGLMIDGTPNYEMFENILLFLPLYPLFMTSGLDKNVTCLGKMRQIGLLVVPFAVSLAIEMIQLSLRTGTFQLSDLAYNTLGGFIGGLIYRGYYRITQKCNHGPKN